MPRLKTRSNCLSRCKDFPGDMPPTLPGWHFTIIYYMYVLWPHLHIIQALGARPTEDCSLWACSVLLWPYGLIWIIITIQYVMKVMWRCIDTAIFCGSTNEQELGWFVTKTFLFPW